MVAFAIFDSRHVTLFLEKRASAPGVQDGKGFAVAVVVDGTEGPVVLLSGLLNHIRGDEMRKEEATSARRWQNQQDNKGPDPDLGRRHASALLPLTSAACSRPPREGPSDFSRDNSRHCPHVLPSFFLGTRCVSSSFYRDSRDSL